MPDLTPTEQEALGPVAAQISQSAQIPGVLNAFGDADAALVGRLPQEPGQMGPALRILVDLAHQLRGQLYVLGANRALGQGFRVAIPGEGEVFGGQLGEGRIQGRGPVGIQMQVFQREAFAPQAPGGRLVEQETGAVRRRQGARAQVEKQPAR